MRDEDEMECDIMVWRWWWTETVYMHFCEHIDRRLGKMKIP